MFVLNISDTLRNHPSVTETGIPEKSDRPVNPFLEQAVKNVLLKFNSCTLACVLALAATSAQAGAIAEGKAQLSLVIHDASGTPQWDLSSELSQFLAVDLALGAVSLSPPSSAIADADGVWTPNTTAIVDGQTVTGLGWHSWQKADGSTGTTADASNPWAASLIVTHLGGLIDPSMSYGFYVKNNTASAQTYSVAYSQSIEPTVSGAYDLEAHIAGALTSTDGGATVSPLPGAALIQRVRLSSDGGLNYVDGGVDVGPGATSNGASATYGPYSAYTSGVAPVAGFNFWQFATSFRLSGNQDIFVASGSATITPVPEPASGLLVLAAAGVLLGVGRRRAH